MFLFMLVQNTKEKTISDPEIYSSHRQNTQDRRKSNTCAAHHLNNNAYCNAVCEYSQL